MRSPSRPRLRRRPASHRPALLHEFHSRALRQSLLKYLRIFRGRGRGAACCALARDFMSANADLSLHVRVVQAARARYTRISRVMLTLATHIMKSN
jgi:hypothetical protein